MRTLTDDITVPDNLKITLLQLCNIFGYTRVATVDIKREMMKAYTMNSYVCEPSVNMRPHEVSQMTCTNAGIYGK